jgi:hypothetical protein
MQQNVQKRLTVPAFLTVCFVKSVGLFLANCTHC